MAYLKAYEKHLSKFKNKSPLMIEIGCGYPQSAQPEGAIGMGGSLQMFREWLGKGTRVVGIDVIEECREYEEPSKGIHIEIGSQTDPNFMLKIIENYGLPDIILDDGSHVDSDMKTTFEIFPYLNTGGTYIVEDCGGNHLRTTGTSHKPKDFKSKDRFLTFAFEMVMQMNQYYANNGGSRAAGVLDNVFNAQNIGFLMSNISFYPNLAIIEKDLNVPMDQMVAPAHYAF